ncbi:MAG TPA: NDP-hexose 4-ketoreductase, partial [Ktedonobacter sp.]|nr:NDP-hexose 4-ketoreductase [Ktedonobacter sp.]
MSDRDRFDKFTERARKVLSLAQEEAQRFQHNYIGTEHLLLGLVREGEGVAAKVLANLGVELNKVRSAVEFIIGRGDRIVLGEIGLTPRAKKVIELAVDEARRLNHHYIGTEHLLLGLVREGEGIAAGVLESLGVNLEKVRQQTIQVLSQSGTSHERDAKHSKTPTIDQMGVDLTADARAGKLDPVIGRHQEIERVIQILSRRQKNNPALIGEPGVGKSAIVEGL